MYDYLYVKSQDSPDLKEALGITPDRCRELCGLIHEIHHAHNGEISIGDILSEASRHCENANELAFVSFIMGTYVKKEVSIRVEQVSSDDVPPPIREMLMRMMAVKSRGHLHPFGEN